MICMSWMTKRAIWIQSTLLLLVLGATGSPVRTQVLGGGVLPPAPAALPVPGLDKLDPLLQIASVNPLGRSRIIVRATSSQTLALLAPLIQQLGGVLGRQLSIIDAQVADIPNTALLTLAASDAVQRIARDRATVGTLERTGAAIGATAARQAYGYDGTGITVAVVDSGVTPAHDDLGDWAGGQRVDRFVDFVNGNPAPYDDYGHGTHVTGIIAGNGFDSGGARSGIAPAARIVALKVLDGAGAGRISSVIAAFGDVLANKDVRHIRIVNVSLGAAVYESYNLDFLTIAAKRLVDAGIVVVAAAGNRGVNAGHPQYGSVMSPGNAPWVLTVGASSHMGTTNRNDDTVAAFSSRGPTPVDYSAKPDLVAPGVGTESLSSPNSYLYNSRSQYLLSGTVPTPWLPYLSLSGTSQATPVVSGTIALMLQANPALTPNAVKAILQYTAQPYSGYDALTQGAGFLNAKGAIELARFFDAPWTDRPSDVSWGHQLVWGNRRVWGGVLTPDANAWFSNVQWGDERTPAGADVVWGEIPAGSNGSTAPSQPWSVHCIDLTCSSADWGSSENVVWGSACGGNDCQTSPLTVDLSNLLSGATVSQTIVWGTNDAATTVWSTGGQTIVWGTSGGDTIVWGTTGQTIVWGTATDGDTIVWGTQGCDDPSCQSVVWNHSGGN
jgi:serine protease AprX